MCITTYKILFFFLHVYSILSFSLSIFLVIFIFFLFFIFNKFFLLDKKNLKEQKNIFECGFKTVNNVDVDLNIWFFASACLVIFYELELIFLIPILLNKFYFNVFSVISYLYLLVVIIFTFFFDVKFKILKWYF